MSAHNEQVSATIAVPKSTRALQAAVILLSLVAVILFRVVHARQLAHDEMQYADSHEAVQQLTEILQKTPENSKLATSLQYMNNESSGMRYAAVDSLESEHGAGIADSLAHAYLDSSTEVRKRALELMPQVDAERGYRLELAALQDEDCWVRDHAVILLATNSRQRKSFVDKRAVPLLMRTMTDTDSDVAPLAIPILMKFTGNAGKDWRYSVLDNDAVKRRVKARWIGWWATHSASWPANELATVAPQTPTRSDPAPDFLVKDIDGNRISLSGLRGKVVLLNFWGTWCPPCQGEMPALVDLDNKYRSKGLAIIGVAVKEKGVDSLRKWCAEHNVKYQQVLDADRVARVYGDCYEVPVSVLIDKNGMLRRRWDGERDFDTFRLAAERLLKE